MPRNILVIDSKPELREALKLLLELDGHTVRVAKDGAEALAHHRERVPSVVVIDDDPPDFSATNLALHLKALVVVHYPKSTLITIAIRGDLAPGEVERLDGFDHVLFKPVAYEQISAVLKQYEPGLLSSK